MKLQISHYDNIQRDIEIVEKKCVGHPDTLADGLAEYLSRQYSLYTKEKYGAVLHHNFDKLGLLGGASFVTFGDGYLTSPIRVLINGRASTRFGDDVIPVNELLTYWAQDFLKKRLPLLEIDRDLSFQYNLSTQSSPGKTEAEYKIEGTRHYWFEPRGLFDLQEHSKLFANDTSLGVGYAPFSWLERIVIAISESLTSESFAQAHPWVGSDVKIMGYRNHDSINITLCVPQIGKFVPSAQSYRDNLQFVREQIVRIIENTGVTNYTISINTRDNFDTSELYLTAIGTSLESGDEGLVGRGNRVNGLITPMRPMSMEGAAGKNPVYHIGKVYHVMANLISNRLFKELGIENEVFLISQSGRDLFDPWIVQVNTNTKAFNDVVIKDIVSELLKTMPDITEGILNGQYSIY